MEANGTGNYNTTGNRIESEDSTTIFYTLMIAGWILFGVVIIGVGLFCAWKKCKRKQNKPKRIPTPRASPLLFRKSTRQDKPSYSAAESVDYSYADVPIVDLTTNDSITRQDTGMHRIKKINELIQTAVPLPPREHRSRSSPDVTVNNVSQAIQQPPVPGVARSRPGSNPLIAALAVNQSLASWPSRQSSSASDAHLRFSRNRQHDNVEFQRHVVDQYTQTGSTNSSDSNRWSTSIDIITSSASYQFTQHHVFDDSIKETTPFLDSDMLQSDDYNERPDDENDKSCDETELLKPVLNDEYSIQSIQNATRRRRSTLSDLHHMVLIHSENEATEEINHSNNEIEDIVQSNSATGDLKQSIHSIVNVDDNVLTESTEEPLATLQELQTLISQKDQRLQRKEEENANLKQKVLELTQKIEEKDRRMRDINSFLAKMVQNFPHDRNSLDLQLSMELTGRVLSTNDQTDAGPNTEEMPLDIYYTRRSENDSV